MNALRKILVLALAIGLFSSCVFAQEQPQKKALMLIAADKFQDDEFLKPLEVLEDNDIDVTVASTTLSEAVGMNGTKVRPDILLKDAKVSDYDAVIFVGGSGAVQYIDDPLAQKLARDAVSANKIVGAICLAPRILANAGVLKDKRATVYPSEGEKLIACGVNYTKQPVEKDGNIITADGPGSARQFGEELLKALLAK